MGYFFAQNKLKIIHFLFGSLNYFLYISFVGLREIKTIKI